MAASTNHKTHTRVSHNDCQECRADCERQFLRPAWPGYQFVTEYLSFAKPRLEAIRAGENSLSARAWLNDFRKALHRRITLKGGAESGRKYNDSYLQRLNQVRPVRPYANQPDATYLRQFAKCGASALK